MKKRGEKGKAKHSHTSRKTESSKSSRSSKSSESSKDYLYAPVEVRQSFAEKEEQMLQKRIDKEVRYLLSPEELPVFLFVCSLIILAFLMNSKSMIFYTAATLFVFWLGHFFHKHNHKPHYFVAILGVFFFPLMLTIVLFGDMLSWFLLFVYMVSGLSTLLIYHYHKRQHNPLQIMWQNTYSKIVAITAGAIVLCLIPFILPDAYLSMT